MAVGYDPPPLLRAYRGNVRGCVTRCAESGTSRIGAVDAWLTTARGALAAQAKLAPHELELGDADIDTLLDLARLAADDSGERTNAPLLRYLVGRAHRDADLDSLADAVRRSTS
jgi:hypothetical protein